MKADGSEDIKGTTEDKKTYTFAKVKQGVEYTIVTDVDAETYAPVPTNPTTFTATEEVKAFALELYTKKTVTINVHGGADATSVTVTNNNQNVTSDYSKVAPGEELKIVAKEVTGYNTIPVKYTFSREVEGKTEVLTERTAIPEDLTTKNQFATTITVPTYDDVDEDLETTVASEAEVLGYVIDVYYAANPKPSELDIKVASADTEIGTVTAADVQTGVTGALDDTTSTFSFTAGQSNYALFSALADAEVAKTNGYYVALSLTPKTGSLASADSAAPVTVDIDGTKKTFTAAQLWGADDKKTVTVLIPASATKVTVSADWDGENESFEPATYTISGLDKVDTKTYTVYAGTYGTGDDAVKVPVIALN